ncbi:TetR/AcrR family transcriptional regulator [Pelagibius sp.]|uniref:TetR/AcrR family transcriptional regulator n=1 Tax=Pelagibius sp. TaxID=1931238 RepID=UPI002613BE5C|nr:TetR/AcrR family transcriptional regulator [Pelagibius sp.]
MSSSNRPLPESEAVLLAGNIKATREDWLTVALDVLISEGVEQVKVLGLAERLSVSRSSFYWYFKSRQQLLDELLEVWEQTNTGAILRQAEAPAQTITEAVCNLFRCFVDIDLYNHQLDFAVREWARRSGPVRRVIDASDARRVAAIRAMFERHGYPPQEAEVRARVLYFMQIGYYTLELHEPLEERLSFVPEYLHAFTGRTAPPEELADFEAYALGVRDRRKR